MGWSRYFCCCLFKKPKSKEQKDQPLLNLVADSSQSPTLSTKREPLKTPSTKEGKTPPVEHYEFDLTITDPDEPLIERTCRISTKNFSRPYILTIILKKLPTDAVITRIETTCDYDTFKVFYEHNQIAYKQNFDINSQQIVIYDPYPVSPRRNSM